MEQHKSVRRTAYEAWIFLFAQVLQITHERLKAQYCPCGSKHCSVISWRVKITNYSASHISRIVWNCSLVLQFLTTINSTIIFSTANCVILICVMRKMFDNTSSRKHYLFYTTLASTVAAKGKTDKNYCNNVCGIFFLQPNE